MKKLISWLLGLPLKKLRTIRSGVKKGEWYRVMRPDGRYYATCHTVGDTIWVDKPEDAEIINSGEAWQMLGWSPTTAWTFLPVPRSDRRHPLHYSIPGVTQFYRVKLTKDGKFFARAIVDGIPYETLAWPDVHTVTKDAEKGMMYANVKNTEAGAAIGVGAPQRQGEETTGENSQPDFV